MVALVDDMGRWCIEYNLRASHVFWGHRSSKIATYEHI